MHPKDTKKPELPRVNIKVRQETYERLIQTKALHEIASKKRLSMDALIVALLDSVPQARVEFTTKAG